MSKQDFLNAVLPPNSRYSLRCVIPKVKTLNMMFDTIDELVKASEEYNNNGYNVYYATAGFGALDNATAFNAVAKQELYIDVDCGSEKPYADKAEGLNALKDFVVKVKLPKPTIVDSGNGIHAHWVFDAAIPIHEWQGIATSLKNLCVQEGFNVDGSCTADVARVMRIPETINFKGNCQASQLTPIKLHSYEQLKAIIGWTTIGTTQKKKPYEMSELTRSLMGNKTSKFERIWKLSKEDEGCEQLLYCIEHSDTLAEPQWRGALSIAEHCEDRDWAIHEISKNYSGYNPEETEDKASRIQGPYTCETFRGIGNAHFCDRCPNKDKIKSPIQLGAEFRVKEGAFTVEVVKPDGEVEEYEVPKYPFPFARGEEGGVYQIVSKDEKTGTAKEQLIVPHDLYVYKRSNEESIGDVAWIRYHLPRDGIRDFPISLAEMSSADKLQTNLASHGVTVFGRGRIKAVQFLFSAQLEALQMQEKADIMHARFGWTENNVFILGGREYSATGVRPVPLADHLKRFTKWMTPTGEVDAWIKAANEYNNERDDFRAFCVMAGFGSVFMEFISDASATMNLHSTQSGTGKTTVQYVVNGIWGHPKELMIKATDTPLSRIHRMGTMNSLSTCTDELSNMLAAEISNFLYASTGGAGKNRMDAKANAERDNHTRWKNISIWSSNTSLTDKLHTIKADPQAELSRVIEFHINTPFVADPLEKKQVFDALFKNYGHPGDIFMRYVLANMDEVRRLLKQVEELVYSSNKWTVRERFKLHTLVAATAGGIIAKQLGLIDYNINRILKSVIATIREEIEHNDSLSSGALEVFGDYFNKNIGGLLVINDIAAGTMKPDMKMSPKIYTELVLRYEPDTKSLYVAQRPFHKWCADNFINTRELKKRFEDETSSKLNTVRKRMAKGWVTDFGVTTAYEIKNAVALLDIDELSLKNVLPPENPTD